jgi:shikimate kinase / 3-dehydroquinate synthase
LPGFFLAKAEHWVSDTITSMSDTAKSKRASGNIILVGMMGAGKTTVGKLLAKHLGKTFIDSDEEIQRRTGVTIPHIFDVEGEAGFRVRESGVIQDVLKQGSIVLATGGGAILNLQNRQLMKQNGIVVYLKSNVHDLWQRTRHDQNRPLLQTGNPRAKLQELHDLRDPLYMETADLVIQTGKQSVQLLLERLQQKLDELMQMNGNDRAIETLVVGLGERSYPIHIGCGLLNRLELLLPHIPTRRAVIVSNTTVAPLYLRQLSEGLNSSGVKVHVITLPDGEQYKSNESLNIIYDELLSARSERGTPLIALGGGVIGDITGYAAATYLRGVPFIQIPTTLLSQVDSSVGGKTGINHPLGKNMIGAFYQPRVVLADTKTLDTLPDKELSAGFAEVIKYGLIRDLPFLEWLEGNIDKLLSRDTCALQYAIAHSCRNKAEVVAADERESGERALLNLGHTFGHAIENGMGYGVWLHGEGVAAGTIMAADLSRRLGWLDAGDVERVRRLFERAGLPIIAPRLGNEKYLQLMGLDKKVADGKIRFVLLKALGQAVISGDVPPSLLNETLEACSA